MTEPAARRFPPRDQLPPGVTVDRLRGLGTTWYERGRDEDRARTAGAWAGSLGGSGAGRTRLRADMVADIGRPMLGRRAQGWLSC